MTRAEIHQAAEKALELLRAGKIEASDQELYFENDGWGEHSDITQLVGQAVSRLHNGEVVRCCAEGALMLAAERAYIPVFQVVSTYDSSPTRATMEDILTHIDDYISTGALL